MATASAPSCLSLFSPCAPRLKPSAHPAFLSARLHVSSVSSSSFLQSTFVPPNPVAFGETRRRANPRTSRSSTITSLFTGIVEEIGEIQRIRAADDGGSHMRIAASTVLGGIQLGDTVAVNGTCLTVSEFDLAASNFSVGLSPETLHKTNLGDLDEGSPVNLERALQPASRMGGHFLQGIIDGTGEIVEFEPEGDSLWVKVHAAPELLRYVVPKGFIAVDGTSLTVVRVYEDEGCFDFMLVAYTQQKVTIPMKKVGDKVNLEVDMLGKYVDNLIKHRLSIAA